MKLLRIFNLNLQYYTQFVKDFYDFFAIVNLKCEFIHSSETKIYSLKISTNKIFFYLFTYLEHRHNPRVGTISHHFHEVSPNGQLGISHFYTILRENPMHRRRGTNILSLLSWFCLNFSFPFNPATLSLSPAYYSMYKLLLVQESKITVTV